MIATLHRTTLSFLFLLASSSVLKASIYCPADKTIYCHDNKNDLNLTGRPTAIGYPSAIVKYIDNTSQTNSCGIGLVSRFWYVDINQNNAYDTGEGNCTQKITVLGTNSNIIITWPDNKEYTCKEEISYEMPTWTTGSCDVMGVSVDSLVFNLAPDACYKIMRKFRVINWCTYQPNNPNSPGVWEYTQLIKVIEKTPPVIAECAPKVIGVDGDCKANFTIENMATDATECSSELLFWTVEIDLWGNGDKDYVYGHLEKGIFKLAAAKNGEKVSITLPERVAVGRHKVYWSVKDQCGNIKTCSTIVETKDTKAPTPYMIPFLTTAFEGSDTLVIKPKCFERGSNDNCTQAKYLRYSFSPNVNDTCRYISCDNAGFQFYEIYVTDLAGNSDFVEVFMLAFDNGSCNSGNLRGNILSSNGVPLQGASMKLSRPTGDEIMSASLSDGTFEWDNISIYQDYLISADRASSTDQSIDIGDLKMLQDYILGKTTLSNYQWIAADVNGDSKINVADLQFLKKMIVYPSLNSMRSNKWFTFYGNDSIYSVLDIAALKTAIPIITSAGNHLFTAVYRGDISGANPSVDEVFNPELNTTLIQNDKEWIISPTETTCHGLHYVISIGASDELPIFYDDNGQIDQKDLFFDKETHLWHIIRISNVAFSSTVKVVSNAVNIELLSTSSTLDQRNKLHPILSKNLIQESVFSVNPNPSYTGTFSIFPKGFDRVFVKNIHGKVVAFVINGNELTISGPSEIYMCEIIKGNKRELKKLLLIH